MTSSILAVRGLVDKTTEAFRRDLVAVADELGVDVDFLAAAMAFETGGKWSPGRYPNGAVGLIQFTTAALPVVNRTKGELAAMGAREQLTGPVKDYLRKVAAGRPLTSLSDVYMAIFAPVAIGAPATQALPYEGEKYDKNKGLDLDEDGIITVGEAASGVQRVYDAAHDARVTVNPPSKLVRNVAITAAAVAVIVALLLRKEEEP